jgi:hypothetical protein
VLLRDVRGGEHVRHLAFLTTEKLEAHMITRRPLRLVWNQPPAAKFAFEFYDFVAVHRRDNAAPLSGFASGLLQKWAHVSIGIYGP